MVRSPLRSPRPAGAAGHRARASLRWRHASLCVVAAAVAFFMVRAYPGSSAAANDSLEVRVTVVRRLGMEGQQQRQGGDGVLSSAHVAAAGAAVGQAESGGALRTAPGSSGGIDEGSESYHNMGSVGENGTAEGSAGAAAAVAATAAAAGIGDDEGVEVAATAEMAAEVVEAGGSEALTTEKSNVAEAVDAQADGAGADFASSRASEEAAAAAAGAVLEQEEGEQDPAVLDLGADDMAAAEGAAGDTSGTAAAVVQGHGGHGNGSTSAQEAAAGGAKGPDQPTNPEPVPLSALEKALRGCKTLECVRDAHTQPKHAQQFNFPHFLILGFPKCATTSLYHHLIQHPTIMAPLVKEPNFFTSHCQGSALTCSLEEQEKYITGTLHLDIALQARLFMAVFEGSVHYSLAGQWLAPQLRELMPWVKLVLSLREPISQAISMLKHNLDHDRIPGCYDPKGSVYKCILKKMVEKEEQYAPRMQAWVESFPQEQLFVMQYENLTDPSSMKRVLREVKRFIGIDAKLPHDDLGLHNSRRDQHTGWPMSRREYRHLVEVARKDALAVVKLIRQHGFANADRWLANWEKAWQRNLNACQPGRKGQCLVQLT